MELKLRFCTAERPVTGLLIVPYGIETVGGCCLLSLQVLLIVPYGIETRREVLLCGGCSPFNRTLWN